MYWIWANERTSDGQARIHGTPEAVSRGDFSFDYGVRIERVVPLIEIVRDEDSQGVLTDNLIAPGVRGLVFSGRLRRVLDEVGVTNIDYYPCRMRNPLDGTSTDDYRVANLIGEIACVNRPKSDLEMDPDDPQQIMFINSLVLIEDAIGEASMFRLAEQKQVIVAHDRVKDACQAVGITGVKFYAPEEFSL